MSSKDLVSDAAQGATKGFLEWTAKAVSSFVKKLKERKLAFIQEPETIKTVKEQYNSGEWKFYQTYIKDRELLFLVRMGLTLRKLEGNKERLLNLRQKIFGKYKVKGLHIAELVQTGILNRYVGILIDELTSIEDFKKEIEEVLKNIEKHVIFVKGISKQSEIIKKASNIVNAHSPAIFIFGGIKPAVKIVQRCTDKLKIILKNYELERASSGEKEILFFKRILRS